MLYWEWDSSETVINKMFHTSISSHFEICGRSSSSGTALDVQIPKIIIGPKHSRWELPDSKAGKVVIAPGQTARANALLVYWWRQLRLFKQSISSLEIFLFQYIHVHIAMFFFWICYNSAKMVFESSGRFLLNTHPFVNNYIHTFKIS